VKKVLTSYRKSDIINTSKGKKELSMNYKFGTKTIKIPDAEIENAMKTLELTKEEAIQMYLEDEGYLENEEQEELIEKANSSGIMRTIHGAEDENKKTKKTQRERVRKEDPEKEMVIAEVAKLLPKFAENVQILNVGKLISFSIGENDYEFDLKRKRKPKK
jgi:hypothetical protein